MDLQYLCEFLAVAELQNFTLASEELYISQSTLSKHIQQMEKELSVELFDRTTRQVMLTEAGKLLLPHARQASQIKNDVLHTVAEYNRKNKSKINIISIPVMAQYDITGAIARFQKKYPHIMLSLVDREPTEIQRLFWSGEFDFAFIRDTIEGAEKLDFVTFVEDRLIAVLPQSHPLAAEPSIELNKLRNEPFIFLDKRTMLYDMCKDICEEAGFTPNVVYTNHRPENIIELISRGMGVGFLMKHHADYYNKHGVQCIEIEPPVKSRVCLARIKSHKMSQESKLFWEFIANYKNN